ncbi:serine protease [Streptomyces bambusae]|uniref:trypsin-like peptidase domain-containing protein n=1 Tax=Streptomyces bambusae TaxID=1550616 RepID=UPI001CFF1E15|nr:trypsin-like peptidase domain-containing protein [Streptomyces bambusae]MCB5164110.1 serine protease [Streptomyces bambusae]
MDEPYLDPEEIRELVAAALEAGFTAKGYRDQLLTGIMTEFTGILPVLDQPNLQLLSDLNRLNSVERLVDGGVPLQIWLNNAGFLTVQDGPRKVFQKYLAKTAHKASGEPDMPPPAEGGGETKEEIVNTDDTVPFGFLQGGETAGRAVAQLKVFPYEAGARKQSGSHAGTGWLIAPGLLVTNHHVINARSRSGSAVPQAAAEDFALQAVNSRSRFDYLDEDVQLEGTAATALEASDKDLDYAVLRLAEPGDRPVLRVATAPLVLSAEAPTAVNIIQHPLGLPKRIALRNNLAFDANDRDVRYFSDTQPGSSGSPVMTDDWRVVALHRSSQRVTDVNYQGKSTAFVNVGTQLSSILHHLSEHSPALYAEITAAQAALGDGQQPEV